VVQFLTHCVDHASDGQTELPELPHLQAMHCKAT